MENVLLQTTREKRKVKILRLELSCFMYQVNIGFHSKVGFFTNESLLVMKNVNELSDNVLSFCKKSAQRFAL